jgi:hypothetical protein
LMKAFATPVNLGVMVRCLQRATLETVDGLLCKSVCIARHRQSERRFVVHLLGEEAFCKS